MSSEINRSYFVQKIIAISFALSLHQLLVSGGIDLAFFNNDNSRVFTKSTKNFDLILPKENIAYKIIGRNGKI